MLGFLIRWQRFLGALVASVLLLLGPETLAQEVIERPLEALGDAVTVQGFRVRSGENDNFREKQLETVDAVIREVRSSRGEPLFEDTTRPALIRLVYPDALVIVDGFHSTRIICRIEIEVSGLRTGLPVDGIIELAARACRSAEVLSWDSDGSNLPTPIGSQELAEIPNSLASIYATDNAYLLFSSLVRAVEVGSQTSSGIVRKTDVRDWAPREGEVVWNYAWFDNGSFLVQRFEQPARTRFGRSEVGFACAVVFSTSEIPRLDDGPLSDWCDHQSTRLNPGLERYVEAVGEYRESIYISQDPPVISPYSGFHFGALPVELTARYWESGEVAD